MQYVSATVVMHDGRFKITKDAISVPEIVVLRRLHGGDDAVRDIRPVYWKRVQSFRAEKHRLLEIYGRKESQATLIEELFPGEFPRLPTSLKDIATGNPVLDGEDSPDAEDYDTHSGGSAPARGRGRKKGGDQPVKAPTPVMVSVPKEDGDEIRIEGEADEDDAPVELAEEDTVEDYSFLNEGKEAAKG